MPLTVGCTVLVEAAYAGIAVEAIMRGADQAIARRLAPWGDSDIKSYLPNFGGNNSTQPYFQ